MKIAVVFLLLFECLSMQAVTSRMLAFSLPGMSASTDESVPDTLNEGNQRTVAAMPQWKRPSSTKSSFEKLEGRLNPIDTNYIEPQRYDFTVMLQNSNSYEVYRLSNHSGQHITFAPKPSIKIGPFFGWRWAFLGYTIDVRHMDLSHSNRTKKEYDVSIYSSMLGIDIYYRKTGNDYRIRNISLDGDIDTSPMKNVEFGGLMSSIKGADAYFIFNHRKFSYPAAFSQSTIQRRSAGSVLLGAGYTEHALSVDWEKLNELIGEKLGKEALEAMVDANLVSQKVRYRNFSLSSGYAYNWVFARNWLAATSLSLSLAYKHTSGDLQDNKFRLQDFTIKNVNLDGIARFALVWNNARWYAGMNAVLHSYNYNKSRFYTNNIFGTLNLYVGFNFGRRDD